MNETTFRAGVGLLVLDRQGHVLAIERARPRGAWQLPQGGLEPGESGLDAAYRELHEETGLRAADVEYVAEHPLWLGYELPPPLRTAKTGRGQTQRWFLFRLTAPESAIVLPASGEAVDWRWMKLADLTERAVEFRRAIYEALQQAFAAQLA